MWERYRLALVAALLFPRSALAQEAAIPVDGLELWVKADGPMKVTNGQVTEWTDASAKANNAIHDAFGPGLPVLATANGRPTLRFSGGYTGFHFTKINGIRTVFAVLSKESASCLPTLPNYGTPAKFWIGGASDPTYFHPEHGCAIYNSNLGEVSPNLVNGKTYLNGKLVEGRTTRFPFTLGLLSIVSLANVAADTIARDRNFQDRSWQGDISELLIYSKPLDDATRVTIQNALASKYAIAVEGGPPIPADGGSSIIADANDRGDEQGASAGTAGAANTAGAGGAAGNDGTAGSDVASGHGGAAPGVGGSEPASVSAAGDTGASAGDASSGCSCVTARNDGGNLGAMAFASSLMLGTMLTRRLRRRRS